jgi:hypothetical protein
LIVHGGNLFAEIVIVAGLVVAGTWLIWIMIRAQDDLRRADQRAHGDVVFIPEEMRPVSKKAGGRPERADGPGTLTHDGPVSHSGSGASQ